MIDKKVYNMQFSDNLQPKSSVLILNPLRTAASVRKLPSVSKQLKDGLAIRHIFGQIDVLCIYSSGI
jgi:hypothetical protein